MNGVKIPPVIAEGIVPLIWKIPDIVSRRCRQRRQAEEKAGENKDFCPQC